MQRTQFPGYGSARFNTPTLYSQYLTFQGGTPFTRTASLAGGGEIVRRNWMGTFPPLVVGYSTPLSSSVGSGIIPSRPGFLQSLIVGRNKATS